MRKALTMAEEADSPAASTGPLDAVVIGAGFAGLYMLHRLREQGLHRARLRGRATASAAPGTGTATRARAATRRACTTRYSF